MASYTELHTLFSDPSLLEKVEVACIVEAEVIRAEDVGTPNHTARVLWAKQALSDPPSVRNGMLKAVLAANKDLAIATIQAATDPQIQAKVSAAVNIFANGG